MGTRVPCLAVLALAWLAGAQDAPVRIDVAASAGEIVPQSKGGGGWQRTFRFRAVPGEHNHWIRQALEVRGTVFDEEGKTETVHLDVIEYYRVDGEGRAIQADSHYSQFEEARGGDLTLSSTLTYGALEALKRGDAILSRSFILRSAVDDDGEPVEMRKRTTREVIPAELGERVGFRRDAGCIPTHYAYRVRWDARPGHGSRTQPSGEVEVGTWHREVPEQAGHTRVTEEPRPIPELERGR